ncbi:MAG: hypothetical protein LGR52_13020 [Candidatus Thiosymbion ectosymbiont of Robbea hypermnestra]|nr:hypothetical protein [Candidatus Thiosymbion ectosymbiont of Robbea hypermnestra]
MRLVLIVEAQADAVSAGRLADRVLIACGPDWVTADAIEDLRRWTGLETDTPFTAWRDLKEQARSHSVRVHGRNRGPDHTAARRALAVVVIVARGAPIDALILIRDLDNQPERRRGLEEARKEMAPKLGFPVVIGTANPEREAWLLNGFVPRSERENRGLEQATNRLGFDPTRQPHRLRGDTRRSDQEAGRDIKKVLAELVATDPEREQACLRDTPLEVLIDRGRETGLSAFLREVHTQLLPLFDPAPSKPCNALAG